MSIQIDKRQQIIHIAIFNLLPCIYTSHAFKFHNNSWLIWELFVQIKSVSILYNLLDILNDLSQKCLYMEYNNIKHCNFYCKSAEMFVARQEITTESDKLLGRPFMCNFLIISYHLRFDPLSLNISTKKKLSMSSLSDNPCWPTQLSLWENNNHYFWQHFTIVKMYSSKEYTFKIIIVVCMWLTMIITVNDLKCIQNHYKSLSFETVIGQKNTKKLAMTPFFLCIRGNDCKMMKTRHCGDDDWFMNDLRANRDTGNLLYVEGIVITKWNNQTGSIDVNKVESFSICLR